MDLRIQINVLFCIQDDYGVCDYKIVGSAGDGFGYFASAGSNKHLMEQKSVLTQDVDLNIFLNNISIREDHCKAIEGSIGFTFLKFSPDEVFY